MAERVDTDKSEAPTKRNFVQVLLIDPFRPRTVDGISSVAQSSNLELADTLSAGLTYLCNIAPIFAGPGSFYLFSKGHEHWPKDSFTSAHAFSYKPNTTTSASSPNSAESRLEAAKQFAGTFRRSLFCCESTVRDRSSVLTQA